MRRLMAQVLVGLGACLLAPPLSAGTITQYWDFNAWAAAVSHQYATEDFEDQTLVAGLNHPQPGIAIADGSFYDAVSRGEGWTVWYLDEPSYGFGGYWDLSINGIGQNLSFIITSTDDVDQQLVPSPALGEVNPFYGFVTDYPFQYVIVTGGTAGGMENPGGAMEAYRMDFLVFNVPGGTGGDPGGEVPEPGTCLLAGAGLAVLALLRRR